MRLLAPDGSEVWREDGWPWGAATTGWPVREIRPDGHTIALPADLRSGPYKVELSIYDPDTLDALPVTALDSSTPISDGPHTVAMLQVGSVPEPPPLLDGPAQFEHFFALLGAQFPESTEADAQLPIELLWESLAATSTDYTTFIHLVDANGEQVAGQDQPPLAGFAPTHAWQPGQRFVDGYAVGLPADLPPGEYEVRVGLYTIDGGRLPVFIDGEVGGDFVTLGMVAVE